MSAPADTRTLILQQSLIQALEEVDLIRAELADLAHEATAAEGAPPEREYRTASFP